MTMTLHGSLGATFPGGGNPQRLPAKLLGMSYGEVLTSGTGATLFLWDNSIPLISQGNQVLSVTHTRLSATSKLYIRCVAFLGENSNTTDTVMGALFQDATANALVAGVITGQADSNNGWGSFVAAGQLVLERVIPSLATGDTTIQLRAGCTGAGNVRWNGANGAATKLGNTIITTLTITEIES